MSLWPQTVVISACGLYLVHQNFLKMNAVKHLQIVVGFLYLVQLSLTYGCKCRVNIQFVTLESYIFFNRFFPSGFSCNRCLKASFLFYHYHFTQLNTHCSFQTLWQLPIKLTSVSGDHPFRQSSRSPQFSIAYTTICLLRKRETLTNTFVWVLMILKGSLKLSF